MSKDVEDAGLSMNHINGGSKYLKDDLLTALSGHGAHNGFVGMRAVWRGLAAPVRSSSEWYEMA